MPLHHTSLGPLAGGLTLAEIGLSDRLRSVLQAVGFLRFFVVADDVAAGVTAAHGNCPSLRTAA